jgi:hypothetical protein
LPLFKKKKYRNDASLAKAEISSRTCRDQFSNLINSKDSSNHKIKLKRFFYPRPRSIFLGNIETQNNHYKTLLIEWKTLTLILTILVVRIDINDNFLSLNYNTKVFSLLSWKMIGNKGNKLKN